MNGMAQLEVLAGQQIARARVERADNRERFTAAAELADLFRDMGGKITYATNGRGESIGEPFTDRCKREGLTECRYRPEGVGCG